MNRTIEQWQAINPEDVAYNATTGAVQHLVQSAISDLQELAQQLEHVKSALDEERAAWSAKRAELLRNHDAELARRKAAEAQINELEPQLYAERASLFAENQRKQQLKQQVCMLLGALELLLCDVEEAEYMTGREREAEARAVIQKVRSGE